MRWSLISDLARGCGEPARAVPVGARCADGATPAAASWGHSGWSALRRRAGPSRGREDASSRQDLPV